jgi:hypothetical protein
LDPAVQVCVNGALAAEGRETILPSHREDFRLCKQVTVTRDPVAAVDHSNSNRRLIRISVGLRAVNTAPSESPASVTMDVVYTYNTTPMKQIQHDICNVRQHLSSAATRI